MEKKGEEEEEEEEEEEQEKEEEKEVEEEENNEEDNGCGSRSHSSNDLQMDSPEFLKCFRSANYQSFAID